MGQEFKEQQLSRAIELLNVTTLTKREKEICLIIINQSNINQFTAV